jgi:hypothetical protein
VAVVFAITRVDHWSSIGEQAAAQEIDMLQYESTRRSNV